MRTISRSSSTVSTPVPAGSSLRATPSTRMPSSARSAPRAMTFSVSSSESGSTLPSTSTFVHTARTSSRAPLVTMRVLPLLSPTTTERRLRSKSKGSSSMPW